MENLRPGSIATKNDSSTRAVCPRERILEKCISDYIISIPVEEEELVVVGAGVDVVGAVGEDVVVVTGLDVVGAVGVDVVEVDGVDDVAVATGLDNTTRLNLKRGAVGAAVVATIVVAAVVAVVVAAEVAVVVAAEVAVVVAVEPAVVAAVGAAVVEPTPGEDVVAADGTRGTANTASLP